MAFRRTRSLLLAALVAAPLFAAALAAAPTPASADVAQQCRDSVQSQMPVAGAQTCRSVQADEWGFSSACRREGVDDTQCAAIDDRPVSEHFIDDYQTSWLHRALTLQRALDANAPLSDELIPHTHNTFNSSSYDPTLTNQDPNQVYSITDQLQMDIRAIEIDVHWVPSPFGSPETGGYEVTACHGDSRSVAAGQHVHVGCTADRPFAAALDEVRTWLDSHHGELVLLYLENQLDGSTAGHVRAGDLVASKLGSLVYQPPADQPCAPMPVSTSAATILGTGAQVLIVGNCDAANGAATSWGQYVHVRGPAWDESGDPTNYGTTQCSADLAEHNTAPTFRRYYEEVTWLGTMGDTAPAVTGALGHVEPITADAVSQMVRCGVNIIGLDQLTPGDARLAAMVWSWAADEPAAGATGCAYQGGDTRFHVGSCDDATRHFACRDADGGWHVTAAVGSWADGWNDCATEFPGSSFTVPVNGWNNAALATAATGDEVWLNYQATAPDAWSADLPAPPSLPQSGGTVSGPTAVASVHAAVPVPTPAGAPTPRAALASSTHRAPRLPLAALAVLALAGVLSFWARKPQHDAVNAPKS